MAPMKRIAVVGAGPAGAIAVDALAQEKYFESIKVFERRERPGGCWLQDPADAIPIIPNFEDIANRTADRPLQIPADLPTWRPKSSQYRFSDTSIYPALETNIVAEAMEFSKEPMPEQKSLASIQNHGVDTPFRHHEVVQKYIAGLLIRKGYQSLVEYDTTVERVKKIHETNEWRVTVRKEFLDKDEDYWWNELFDAVVIASGHYNVPFIPYIEGLAEFAKAYPGSVEHSKSFRDPRKYQGKRVVVVGAAISGPDIATMLTGFVESPVHAVVRGRYHPYFGDWAFQNPHIKRHAPISFFSTERGDRTVAFEDGTSLTDVDHVILGTGHSWTLPFLPDMEIRYNRVPGLYQHIFRREDPTLVFVGAIAAGFTFKVYEWQAVLAARFLAGRVKLPSVEEQEQWELDRIAEKGDGVAFTALYPDFEGYFEQVRKLAGEPTNRDGRSLPKFDDNWIRAFEAGHQKRITLWQRLNAAAERDLKAASSSSQNGPDRSLLDSK